MSILYTTNNSDDFFAFYFAPWQIHTMNYEQVAIFTDFDRQNKYNDEPMKKYLEQVIFSFTFSGSLMEHF